ALIRCSCRMGAIIGIQSSEFKVQGSELKGMGYESADDQADNSELRTQHSELLALTRYGEAIGLMFQVVDDLLDVTQTTEHLGKKAGKDADKGKLTYPGLIGIEASQKEVERLEAEAYD